MALSRNLLAALAVPMMTLVSFAAQAQTQPAASGVMGALTQEERLMFFAQMKQQTANMTDDQKRDFRSSQRAKFQAMSDADKQKLAADLLAKWDALPAAQKTQLQQDADKARADHPMMARMMAHRGC
jgi:hypothetical protein